MQGLGAERQRDHQLQLGTNNQHRQAISVLKFDKQGSILSAGDNSGQIVLFKYNSEGGEMLCDESQPKDEKVKYPCIKYMMQFPGFE